MSNEKQFVEVKRIDLPFLHIATAGSFINVRIFGGFIKYETSGAVAFCSVLGWKFYKRVGGVFCLLGIAFGYKK